MRSSTSVAQAVAAVLSGCALASAAQVWGAQADKGDSGPIIEEVIVTVERIEQNLQSYEGTAVVMQQAQLDAVGADSLVDLPALMPGVEITNYEDNTELFVRGIGSNANTELGDPAIAPHLDDVYVPRPRVSPCIPRSMTSTCAIPAR
jgi:iron complex outermembrane receptor protein